MELIKITTRLPTDLVADLRQDATHAGITLQELITRKLGDSTHQPPNPLVLIERKLDLVLEAIAQLRQPAPDPVLPDPQEAEAAQQPDPQPDESLNREEFLLAYGLKLEGESYRIASEGGRTSAGWKAPDGTCWQVVGKGRSARWLKLPLQNALQAP